MDIEKHLFITGTSQTSWKDAITSTIEEASKSIDYLSNVKILEQRAKISGNKGLSTDAAALLISILRTALYTADKSAEIDALEDALVNGAADVVYQDGDTLTIEALANDPYQTGNVLTME